MYYLIYIILSMIVAGFAVRDYAQETARRNIIYLSGVWVAFCIFWPLVIGNHILQACRDIPEIPAAPYDYKLATNNYCYRSNFNCSAEYLEKVKHLIQTSPVSIKDIDLNEFNFDRRLSIQELDLMAKASVYGITTNLRDIENIEQLLANTPIT